MGLRVISVTLMLKGEKSLPKDYPTKCDTIGSHIRKVRMDKGLSQPELCSKLGVSVATITNWELNRSQPLDINLPDILEFLGYVPSQIEPQLPRINHPIFQYRVQHGILLKDLAKELGIERGTLRDIEKGKQPQREPVKSIIQEFLKRLS